MFELRNFVFIIFTNEAFLNHSSTPWIAMNSTNTNVQCYHFKNWLTFHSFLNFVKTKCDIYVIHTYALCLVQQMSTQLFSPPVETIPPFPAHWSMHNKSRRTCVSSTSKLWSDMDLQKWAVDTLWVRTRAGKQTHTHASPHLHHCYIVNHDLQTKCNFDTKGEAHTSLAGQVDYMLWPDQIGRWFMEQ